MKTNGIKLYLQLLLLSTASYLDHILKNLKHVFNNNMCYLWEEISIYPAITMCLQHPRCVSCSLLRTDLAQQLFHISLLLNHASINLYKSLLSSDKKKNYRKLNLKAKF